MLHPVRREGHPGVETGFVLRHGCESGERRTSGLEPVEFRVDERTTELARTVGAEVDEDRAVTVCHRRTLIDHRGLDEFVVFVAAVSGFQRFGRTIGLEFGPSVSDCLPCA